MIWSEDAIKLMEEVRIFVLNKYKILELDFNEEAEKYIIHNTSYHIHIIYTS